MLPARGEDIVAVISRETYRGEDVLGRRQIFIYLYIRCKRSLKKEMPMTVDVFRSQRGLMVKFQGIWKLTGILKEKFLQFSIWDRSQLNDEYFEMRKRIMVELHLKFIWSISLLNYNKRMKNVSILKCTTPLKVVIKQRIFKRYKDHINKNKSTTLLHQPFN